MGKEKKYRKILKKIEDAAAAAVVWHDEAQGRLIRWLPILWAHIVSGGAKVILVHDRIQARFDRMLLILRFNTASFIHKNRKKVSVYKKTILTHFAGFVLVAVAIVAMLNYATGYEYSYNGKVLGYVKNQEDVIKVLDLVSTELSKEHGTKIEIDTEDNISFQTVVTLDKEIDNIDTVLKRLTYLSDMEAEAYCIYIDGVPFVTCETQDAAEYVLKSIQQEYLEEDGDIRYESVGFKEDVEIRKVETRLTNISSMKAAKKIIESGGSEELVYEVKAGDTYSEIFKEFDVTFEELKETNPKLSMDSLFPGDKIIINEAVSAVTVTTVEKATYAEKIKYKTEIRKDSSKYENDESVIQKGVNGKQVVTARITRENGKIIAKDVLHEEVIKKPVKKIVVKGTKKLPKTAPTGTYIMPVSGYTLTSEFGWRWGRNHDGLDLACGTGTPIWATDGGTVIYAGWYSGYGLFIEIDHGNGIHSRYGHCNSLNVSRGDKVYQGQKIGEVGNTGNSFGSHCHFEITVNGRPVDPFIYL